MRRKIDRKEFLKLVGGAAGAASISSVIWTACKKDIKKAAEATPVIWLQGLSCSGCSISLLNATNPDIPEFITKYISLNFHQTLSAGTGNRLIEVLIDAIEKKRRDYILVVEGAIPTSAESYCTVGTYKNKPVSIGEWVKELGKNAKGLIAVGSCAAFGGIPAARGNVTGAKSLSEILPKSYIINLPGCPAYPDWVTVTLMHFLMYGKADLDEYKRPKMFYGKTVHEQCSRLQDYKKGKFAQLWGEDGCLYNLGCLGMDTGCDISKRKWLGVNSCTGCGSGCIGCTEDVFPDTGDRGLYQHRVASAEISGKREA